MSATSGEGPIRPVILAGGAGTRLWPLSTIERPKHLLPLIGDRCLLEQTLGRFGAGFAKPMIIANAALGVAIRASAPRSVALAWVLFDPGGDPSRVYDYAGHRVAYHGGAVQGYRGAIALVPDRDLGVVILWNSTSGVPSGLMPTILDSALGLHGDWLDLDENDVELLYATRKQAREYGSDASTSRAKPH